MMTTVSGKRFRWTWVAALLLVGGVGAYAWTRVGLLDLPSVPGDVTIAMSGLDGLPAMKELNDALYAPLSAAPSLPPAAADVRAGLLLIEKKQPARGLEQIRKGVRSDPTSLVLSNAYRMAVFRLRRDLMIKQQTNPTIAFPEWLDHAANTAEKNKPERSEPIAFLLALDQEHPCRETKLALALGWVDMMLLFPALEIKAPSSVESVKYLDQLIGKGDKPGTDPYYVPALYGRGLNHLHRPARLVWPDPDKQSPEREDSNEPLVDVRSDAAVKDIGRAIAVGRKFGVGSAKLQATLAISLGDSYVKAGRNGVARSWWQIAQNLSPDASIQEALRRKDPDGRETGRYAWKDEEMLDRLEEELDRARTSLDSPMTDLRMMWE